MTEFEKYMENLDKKINNMKSQKDARRFLREGKKFGLSDNGEKEDGNKKINRSL